MIVETLPFQRISAISRHFEALDPKIDIPGTLRKPFHRRKETLFDELESLVQMRHDLIHRATLNMALTDESITDAIYDLEVAVTRVYKRLTSHYSWAFDRGWYLGRRPTKVGAV